MCYKSLEALSQSFHCLEFGVAVGRLHAGTRGAGDGYRQALADLGAPEADAGPGLPWPGVDRWRDVEVVCAELGLPDARVAADDAAFVQDRIADAGPLAALTHTDLNPGNALVTPHGFSQRTCLPALAARTTHSVRMPVGSGT